MWMQEYNQVPKGPAYTKNAGGEQINKTHGYLEVCSVVVLALTRWVYGASAERLS